MDSTQDDTLENNELDEDNEEVNNEEGVDNEDNEDNEDEEGVDNEDIDDELDDEPEDDYDDDETVDVEPTTFNQSDEDDVEFIPRNINDNDYIKTFHPEVIPISFDDMYKRSIITRNKDGVIIDDNHSTLPLLSKYEKTKIIGLRVNQLNKGSQPFIEGQQSTIDSHLIATQELFEKKIPFIIKRPLPNGKSEFWFVKDLELI